jgi:hypothetical protein
VPRCVQKLFAEILENFPSTRNHLGKPSAAQSLDGEPSEGESATSPRGKPSEAQSIWQAVARRLNQARLFAYPFPLLPRGGV